MAKPGKSFFFQLLLMILTVIMFLLFAKSFDMVDALAAAQSTVQDWGSHSLIYFPLMMAACNLLLLPGGILSVAAGFFFGLWWGSALLLVGNALSTAIAVLISRHVARRFLEKCIRNSPRLSSLDQIITRDGWKFIFLSQLHPLFPTSLLNYLYGLSRMPVSRCVFWSTLGKFPGLFLYTYLGTVGQLSLKHLQSNSTPQWHEYLLWGAGLFFSLVLTSVLGNMALKMIQEANAHSKSPPSNQNISHPEKNPPSPL